jgi:hypothetical protein
MMMTARRITGRNTLIPVSCDEGTILISTLKVSETWLESGAFRYLTSVSSV